MRKPHLFTLAFLCLLGNSIPIVAQETITICLGESVFIDAIQNIPQPPTGPAGPDGNPPFNCTPNLNEIAITPNQNAIQEDLRGFMVAPTVSTVYFLTSSGGCGAPGLGFVSGEERKRVEVIVDQSCAGDVEEIYTICLGGSIRLDAIQNIPRPPTGPAGPDGNPPFNCTPNLSEISINPAENANQEDLQGFVVSPAISTIYTLISSGGCGAPGVGFVSGEASKRIAVLVDQSCTANVDETYTICLGESISLEAIQNIPRPPTGPAGPDGNPPFNCTPNLSEISIRPTENTNQAELQGFMVAPTATTVYTLTSSGGCGAPGVGFVSGEASKRVAIIVDQSCGVTTNIPPLFTEYPWLRSIVNPDQCIATSIVVYQLGIDQYATVTDADGKESLYYQNGALYCQSQENYDCKAIYGLTTVLASGTCDGGAAPVADCANHTGTFFFDACDNGDLFFFLQANDGRILDPYFNGGVSFDPIEGQVVNFDYVTAGFDSPCTIADEAVTITCVEVIPTTVSESEYPFFDFYPWITNLIDLNNCTVESITEYNSGSFYFIYIDFGDRQSLYFENGDFYCMDQDNYDCRALYGLDTPIFTWNCNNVAPSNTDVRQTLNTTLSTTNLKAYPNPTRGLLQVAIPEIPIAAQQLNVYDLYGQRLKHVAIDATTMELNMSSFPAGVYYVEWIAGTTRQVEKVVKQ